MHYKFASYALTLEIGALLMVLNNSTSLAVLAAYLATHAGASAMLAVLAQRLMPRQYKQEGWQVLGYFFVMNFFMPVAGPLCILIGIGLPKLLPHRAARDKFDTIEAPRFTTHRNHEGTGFRGGQVRAQLGNAGAPLTQRLKALMAVQETPVRVTGPLLRDLLADPTDDVRLLAYGILDNKEKQLTQRIVEYRHRVELAADQTELVDLRKRLAELYWELIYQNLVQGDMLTFAAEQARHYGYQALERDSGDAGLWFRMARLQLYAGNLQEAEYALAHAQLNGFSRERLLPYWAEQRFLQKRFAEVRILFEELAGQAAVPALGQARRYWLAGHKEGASR